MAITHDVSASGTLAGAQITFAINVGANNNRLLVVGVNSEGSVAATDYGVSGITYNGVAMTKIDGFKYNDGGASVYDYVSLWYLLAPATGNNNVVVSFNVTPNSNAYAGATSLYNVKQQAHEDTEKANATSSTPSVAITTQTADAWVIDVVAHYNDSNAFTVGAGQTERYQLGSDCRVAGSTEPGGAAGAKTMSWSLGFSKVWGIIAACFEEGVSWIAATSTIEFYLSKSFDASGIDTDIYGLTFDGQYLWVVGNNGATLNQVDVDGKLIKQIDISGIAADVRGIVFHKNTFWVYDADNSYLVQISFAGVPLKTIDISGITTSCYGIAFDGLYFWITDVDGQKIYQVNLDGKAISSFTTTYLNPTGICFLGNNLAVIDETKRTLEIYSRAGVQIGVFNFDPFDNVPRAITFDGVYLWVSGNENDYIYQIKIG